MKTLPSFAINGRRISPSDPPYIIAELSANHNGSIESAFKLIELAKAAGADAVKIQTYTADTITLDCNNEDFMITDGLWKGQTLYQLYSKASMPWNWHKPLFDFANQLGITLFSSPFDTTAVNLLEDLDAPAYKIASFEAIDIPLIKYVASKGKPMIISTGMADEQEISDAVEAAQAAGCKELALLHCVSGYPAQSKDYNLATLVDMKNKYNLVTGLSDHTLENTTAIASIALGACLIEKHFTLDRNGGGPDDSFSLEPQDLIDLCEKVKTAWQSVGHIDYGLKSSEIGNIKFRRSLYYTNDIKKGDVIRANDVRSVRPGFGLPPKYMELIVGSRATKDLKANTPTKSGDFNLDIDAMSSV